MTSPLLRSALPALAALALLAPAGARAADPACGTAATAFVQAFYDGYLSLARRTGTTPAWIKALDRRPPAFDPPLARALRADAAAQAQVSDDIVGLDFDPFLNAQDPPDRLIAGPAEAAGGACRVPLFAARKAGKASRPVVTTELRAASGGFVFTDFRYGAGGDLLRTLEVLRAQRARPAR